MTDFEQRFPPLLAELHNLEFDYDEGEGIDFEPYQEFQSAEDNAAWIQAWTGNKKLTGSEYRIFGQDGTGGYAAFWLVRPGADVLAQPIVFFGSEGEIGVVASDFGDYLWLLASGIGPYEAVSFGADEDATPSADFVDFATRNAPTKKTARQVLDRARAEFPDFEDGIRALTK
ncbi:MAG TPA: hypothetical protein VK698_17295 [Kofleriaceae bacterium]|nr:hypothetical protein [Kofleriaceae bacterium]